MRKAAKLPLFLAVLLVLVSGAGLAAVPQELAPLAQAYGAVSTLQVASRQQLTYTAGVEEVAYTRNLTFLWDKSGKFFLGDTGLFAPNLASDGSKVLLNMARAGISLEAPRTQAGSLANELFWALMMAVPIPAEAELHLLTGGDMFEGATVELQGAELLGETATTKYVATLAKGERVALWVEDATRLLKRWTVDATVPTYVMLTQTGGRVSKGMPQEITLHFVAENVSVKLDEPLPDDFGAKLAVPTGFISIPAQQSAPPEPSGPSPDGEPSAGADAKPLDFNAKLLDGDMLQLASLEGPVIVDFFSTGCQPCKNGVQHLRELGQKYASQGLKVVILALDYDSNTLKDFFGDDDTLLVVFDPTKVGELANEFRVTNIPRTLYLDSNHVVVSETVGYGPEMDFSPHLSKIGITP